LEENPALKGSLGGQLKTERPRLEIKQPLLLQVSTIDLAMHSSAAHEKRRSKVYRSIATFDELTEQLRKNGSQISRSGVYLRLLPWRSFSLEGKRHVVTVPVSSSSPAKQFAFKALRRTIFTATIRCMESLVSLWPTRSMFF
jgi:hypothetical protein